MTKQIYTFSDKFQVRTYQDCEVWAKEVVARFRLLKSREISRGEAMSWLSIQVASFAIRMQKVGLLNRIHECVVLRLRNVRVQQRSRMSIIVLLLTSEDPKAFPRYTRFRLAQQAEKVL